MTTLTLAHSGDPDDAFMWWPLTGKVWPDGSPRPGRDGQARISSGRFAFRAVPGDISAFNRAAATPEHDGGAPYDITALSVRAWADVAERYIITDCGASFGEGYGPKIVCKDANADISCINCVKRSDVRIAVPGLRTSAFMTMALALGIGGTPVPHAERFIEVPFDQIIPAVVSGCADAGLVIHEAQVTFKDVGLREVLDLGRWWDKRTGLPLPLGVNAIKRDLDQRFGPGSVQEVARLLEQSLDYAMAHRDESVDYTMAFAELNAKSSGTPAPTRELVERYIDMYVTRLTVNMGQEGRTAIRWLLDEGADAGMCPRVSEVETV